MEGEGEPAVGATAPMLREALDRIDAEGRTRDEASALRQSLEMVIRASRPATSRFRSYR